MRKLFRFKYEPCAGTCYAWCDHLPNELNKSTEEQRKALIEMMVKAHNSLCDNPDYSFGIDMDEKIGVFVGHFRTPEKTNVYAHVTFADCVTEICSVVLSEKIPVIKGACTYGDNGAEDLGKEILRACIDEVYREKHHQACPCHNVA